MEVCYTKKVDQYVVLYPLVEDLAPRVFTISHRNMRAPVLLTYFALDGLLYRNIIVVCKISLY